MKTLAGIIGYLALVALILGVGWNEPIRNRFLSPDTLATEARERAAAMAPVATPIPTPHPILQGHTALDRLRH